MANSFTHSLENTAYGRLRRVFTKVSPMQIELIAATLIFGVAAFTAFRHDIMLPRYSSVVQGNIVSACSDPIDSYRLEPILDDNGKLKAMRKIRVTP
jgi:hypothetical protein